MHVYLINFYQYFIPCITEASCNAEFSFTIGDIIPALPTGTNSGYPPACSGEL